MRRSEAIPSTLDLSRCRAAVEAANPITVHGRITRVTGLIAEAKGPAARIGSICSISPGPGRSDILAEVVGFRDDRVLLMPFEEIRGIAPGNPVVAQSGSADVGVGRDLVGRVLDGLGNPIDGDGPVAVERRYPLYADPVNPISRSRIVEPLDLGIRSVNGLLTVGRGQRMGIFAGSGVGKSVLLGMIAKTSRADVNVVALVGERGRELNDFLDRDLGEQGRRKSVIVVATSDQPPLIRLRAAFLATSIAEFFRDQGRQVLLMMDSLTRFAMARREVGLAAGEPPTMKGYTPSVFTLLPRLLERAGTSAGDGGITGLYTVLVEGDDMNDPIADTVRSILDGHIVLSRELAMQNHYPAIDVLGSISRLMNDIAGPDHQTLAGRLKEILATYKNAEDLIQIGAYKPGSNQKIDYAIGMKEPIDAFLKQGRDETVNLQESIRQLQDLLNSFPDSSPNRSHERTRQ